MPKKDSNGKPARTLKEVRPKSKWTIIILMAAESDLQEDFKDVYDQMARVGSNANEVNFVVIFDGLNIPRKKDGKVTVYHVIRNNFFKAVTENETFEARFEDLDDLSKPENLEEILRLVKTTFPADHTGFIYKGHGGPNPDISNEKHFVVPAVRSFVKGKLESPEHLADRILKSLPQLKASSNGDPQPSELEFLGVLEPDIPTTRGPLGPVPSSEDESPRMVLFRRSQEDLTELSYAAMASVLEKVFPANLSSPGLDFVCLDACWGQLIENGLAFKKVSPYLVASADEMAIMGIGYEGFCNFLVSRPDVLPGELADLMVSQYFQTEYNDYLSAVEFNHMGVSLTCIETDYMNDVNKLMNELSVHLANNISTHFYIIHLARLQCKAYTYDLKESDYGIYNIDLIWFLENLQYYNCDERGEPIDSKLDVILSKLILVLSLYYIKSYMSSNYVARKPGKGDPNVEPKTEKDATKSKLCIEPIIGGKGIGIIFPSKLIQFNDSLYGDDSESKLLSEDWQWRDFLRQFVNRKKMITSKKTSEEFLEEEIVAFSKFGEPYLNWYNPLGDYSKDDSIKVKLMRAHEAIRLNIDHKWVKSKAITEKLEKEIGIKAKTLPS